MGGVLARPFSHSTHLGCVQLPRVARGVSTNLRAECYTPGHTPHGDWELDSLLSPTKSQLPRHGKSMKRESQTLPLGPLLCPATEASLPLGSICGSGRPEQELVLPASPPTACKGGRIEPGSPCFRSVCEARCCDGALSRAPVEVGSPRLNNERARAGGLDHRGFLIPTSPVGSCSTGQCHPNNIVRNPS